MQKLTAHVDDVLRFLNNNLRAPLSSEYDGSMVVSCSGSSASDWCICLRKPYFTW